MTANTNSTGGGASSSAALRSCAYIKENDIKLGLSIASHKLHHTGVINGLRCRFCIAFGRKERVGAKRKPPAVGQSWVAPFRYNNIESHMKKQHPSKWAEYEAVKNSWKSFTKPFLRVEQSNLFFTKKDDATHRARSAPLSWITFKL
jgi:hypothetical protein